MIGFSEEELRKIMIEQKIEGKKQEEIIPIMKENYDGYKFSIYRKEKMYICKTNIFLYRNELKNIQIKIRNGSRKKIPRYIINTKRQKQRI